MDNAYLSRLADYISSAGWLLEKTSELNYGVQLFFSDGTGKEIVRVYQNTKGKITLDASQIRSEAFRSVVLSFEQNPRQGYPLMAPPLIGTDEAGKGDYFGPLCVCAVYVNAQDYQKVLSLGVKDSKLLKDDRIAEIAEKLIASGIKYSIVKIGCAKFNEIYEKTKNINAIMGWAHAAAVKSVLKRQECSNILTDKYGSEHWLLENLNHPDLFVVQQPKAEQNAAVAAASILARNAYVSSVKKMRENYHTDFPFGAGSGVDGAAKKFVEKFGGDRLPEVAKISFKNTSRIL